MAVLGIIDIYIIFLVLLYIVIKADDALTRIITLVLWVALILWLVIGKPAFWEGHKALKVVGEILCLLVGIGMLPKDKKDDEENKDEK
ncbi:MAG: hypothetical protein MJY84_01810 [Bacteroidales bacterium]|nr:hypothetical protein [Bacteroidales bacterium]